MAKKTPPTNPPPREVIDTDTPSNENIIEEENEEEDMVKTMIELLEQQNLELELREDITKQLHAILDGEDDILTGEVIDEPHSPVPPPPPPPNTAK